MFSMLVKDTKCSFVVKNLAGFINKRFIFDLMNNDLVVVSQSKKELWKRVMASFAFTLSVWYLFLFIVEFSNYQKLTNVRMPYFIWYHSYYFFVVFVWLVWYSIKKVKIKQVVFSLNKNKIRKKSIIGPFVFKSKWEDMYDLEYVSVYSDRTEGDFELHLWFKDNKRIRLFESDNWAELFFLGYQTANKLNIDFYNSLHHVDKYWVDLSVPALDHIDNMESKYKGL